MPRPRTRRNEPASPLTHQHAEIARLQAHACRWREHRVAAQHVESEATEIVRRRALFKAAFA